MKMFELDYKIMNMLKKSVDLGIEPLEAIIEANKLHKEYTDNVKLYSIEDAKKYVINGLEIFYNLK